MAHGIVSKAKRKDRENEKENSEAASEMVSSSRVCSRGNGGLFYYVPSSSLELSRRIEFRDRSSKGSTRTKSGSEITGSGTINFRERKGTLAILYSDETHFVRIRGKNVASISRWNFEEFPGNDTAKEHSAQAFIKQMIRANNKKRVVLVHVFSSVPLNYVLRIASEGYEPPPNWWEAEVPDVPPLP